MADDRRRGGQRSSSDLRRLDSYRTGLAAEYVAAACLMARGHRVIARRYKTSLGEVDLITRKGRRIHFVEVKYRATRFDCELAASEAVARRVKAAADLWIAKHRAYHGYSFAFDLVFVRPWRLPQYLPNAL